MAVSKHGVNMVIKARDEASKKFGKVGRSAKGMGSALKKAMVFGAAYLGARQLWRIGKDLSASYGKQEEAVKHLTDALELLNKKAEMPEMQKFASQIQEVTRIGDETTLELMAMGSAMGKLSGDTLKSATVAAIGM